MSVESRWTVAAPPDLRLVPAVPAAWLAAWWGVLWPVRGCLVAAALALVAVAVSVAVAGARGAARLRSGWACGPGRSPGGGWTLAAALGPAVLAALAAGAVFGSVAFALDARSAGPLPGWIGERAVVEVAADVVGDPTPLAEPAGRQAVGAGGPRGAGGAVSRLPSRYALKLRADQVVARGLTARASAPLLAIVGPQWKDVTAGERLRATGRLAAAQPGDDVVAILSVYGGPGDVDPGGWVWRLAATVRAGLRQACRGLPADSGGLLPSLVVGDTATLPPQLRDDLRTAGLTHITAVSGANVAIVAGSALWLAARAGARRPGRIVLATLALGAFVVVARPQPSVLRAAAMGAIGLAALATGRRRSGLHVLASTVVVLLVVDPWLARSPGFALSSAATAALIVLAPVWAGRLQRRLPRAAAVAIAVPASAQAVCGPLLVLLQPSVSLVAVPANLLAEPAVAPATVLGVVAALIGALSPAAAHPVAWCAAAATGWIAVVAHRSAALPAATLPWPAGVSGALLLAVLTAAVIALSLRPRTQPRPRPTGRLRSRAPQGRGPAVRPAGPRSTVARRAVARPAAGPRAVALSAPGVGLLALLAVLAPGLGWVVAPRLQTLAGRTAWPPTGWSVAMCDVGQGDAMVARSGPDRAVLVDAGPDPTAVDRCLRRLGVRHLDLVVLTHHHADHVMGLPGALLGRDVTHLLVSPLAEPVENAALVRRWAVSAGVPATQGWAGASGEAGAQGWRVHWRLLAPDVPPTPGDEAGGDDGTAVNESSLVTELDVSGPAGSVRVVGLGDLETDGQHRLEQRLASGSEHLDGPVDVVKVAHHGSAKQDAALYRRLAPRVALIGVGAGNDYGHPAASALSLLRDVDAAVFRTDEQGSAAVVAGPSLVVATDRGSGP